MHFETHHVLYGWPRDRPGVEVLFQERSARIEVSIVELVRNAPPQRTKFSPFLEGDFGERV